MKKIVYQDYDNCLTNLSNSILKHFGIEPFHTTLKVIDDILESKDYENIILILNDGLSTNILKEHLSEDTFLRRHIKSDITSTFPATTTACTTSVITGLNPAEHCWIGWDVYVKDIDKTVTLYTNTIKDTEVEAADYNVGFKFFPYKTIFDHINEKTEHKAYFVSPYGDVKYDFEEPDKMYSEIKRLCQEKGKKFIYGYCNNPDNLMHDFGTDHPDVKKRIEKIDSDIKKLSQELKNSLIISTADHGHIDVKYKNLDDYPSIKKTLVRTTSIEARAANFFVKDNLRDEFVKEFREHLGEHFTLFTKQEVVDRQLFGPGEENPRFRSCLGDYLALATSDYAIIYDSTSWIMKSTHGGVTKDETIVPLIIIDTDNLNQ